MKQAYSTGGQQAKHGLPRGKTLTCQNIAQEVEKAEFAEWTLKYLNILV